jgi:hypothetical protein
MARIANNTSGSQPILEISLAANMANPLAVPFLQNISIKNSTGVHTYTSFSDADVRKLSTPADNEITTNIVLDKDVYFGNSAATANTAAFAGLSSISINKNQIYFKVYYAGSSTGTNVTSGTGFITNLTPTTNPTAPVWVSPMSIAVDGALANSVV